MIQPPKKLLLAIEAVLDIAYHAGGDPVQSSDISARQGISRRYLEPVLQQLVRAGVLRGVRGPRGGYRLARERRRTTLGEIGRALAEAASDDGLPASLVGAAVVVPLWQEVQASLDTRFDSVTIEDLCTRARDAGVKPAAARPLDFTI